MHASRQPRLKLPTPLTAAHRAPCAVDHSQLHVRAAPGHRHQRQHPHRWCVAAWRAGHRPCRRPLPVDRAFAPRDATVQAGAGPGRAPASPAALVLPQHTPGWHPGGRRTTPRSMPRAPAAPLCPPPGRLLQRQLGDDRHLWGQPGLLLAAAQHRGVVGARGAGWKRERGVGLLWRGGFGVQLAAHPARHWHPTHPPTQVLSVVGAGTAVFYSSVALVLCIIKGAVRMATAWAAAGPAAAAPPAITEHRMRGGRGQGDEADQPCGAAWPPTHRSVCSGPGQLAWQRGRRLRQPRLQGLWNLERSGNHGCARAGGSRAVPAAAAWHRTACADVPLLPGAPPFPAPPCRLCLLLLSDPARDP